MVLLRNAPWNWAQLIVDEDGKATPEFLAWLQQQLTTAQVVGTAVPQSRLINTGTGLTGGGDLTSDRTISLDTANTRNVDHAAVSISAGTGLSGGGTIAANRTINLANTTVSPGSYTNTNLTVDAQGRITAASNGSGGGGGSPTINAHRYWRMINRGQHAYSNYSGYCGIEFRITPGGANVATGGTQLNSTPVQATAGTVFGGNGTGSDFIQFDAGSGTGSWVGYDFGSGNAKSIVEISVYPLWADINRTPNSIQIQFSDDGLAWFDVVEVYCPQSGYTYNTQRLFTVPTTIPY